MGRLGADGLARRRSGGVGIRWRRVRIRSLLISIIRMWYGHCAKQYVCRQYADIHYGEQSRYSLTYVVCRETLYKDPESRISVTLSDLHLWEP